MKRVIAIGLLLTAAIAFAANRPLFSVQTEDDAAKAGTRHLLLTHIHLDHAGATGTIVRRHPHIRVHVHERGAVR